MVGEAGLRNKEPESVAAKKNNFSEIYGNFFAKALSVVGEAGLTNKEPESVAAKKNNFSEIYGYFFAKALSVVGEAGLTNKELCFYRVLPYFYRGEL